MNDAFLMLDIPSSGSGGPLMEAILAKKQSYVLLVRNQEATKKILSSSIRDKVVMHECQPFTNETVAACLKTLNITDVIGVLCAIDVLLPLAANLAHQYNCCFAKQDVIDSWLDKGIARQLCVGAHIRVPAFECIHVLSDTLNSWNQFPAIVKPRRGSGGLGVKRVDNREELFRFFEHLKRPFDSSDWMIEVLLSGTILSVEGYVLNEEITVLGLSDRTWGVQPYFVEVGVNFPVLENTALKEDIILFTQQVITQSRYHHGFFHLELMLTPEGIFLIELNLRYGGPLPMQIELTYDVDFYEGLLALSIGEKPQWGVPKKGCAIFYFYPPKQGVWRGFDEAIFTRYPEVVLCRWNPNRNVGDILAAVTSFRDYLCLVYIQAETAELAHAIMRALWSEFASAVRIEPIQKHRVPKPKRKKTLSKMVQSIRKRLSIY
jgi:hypothetical protein